MGRHIYIKVSDEDRAQLEGWLRASNTKRSLADRARIIIMCGAGESGAEVANKVGATPRTVYKWCKRYNQGGIAALHDNPRSGQPRKLSEDKSKEILRLTVERIPSEATHWSIRLMAKYAKVTQHQVRQVWKAADLRPHRIKTFKISNDPHFAEKVVDVVGLYLNPPDNAMVLSVDEKTQIQALDRTQPMLQLKPGQIERRTHDYVRHGTANIYAAFDIATGQVMTRLTQRHRGKEFLAFLRHIEKHTQPDLDLHIILDNSSTHSTEKVKAWLARHPRFKLHFTPTSASWLNAVENWFSLLERRAIRRNAFMSVQDLISEIKHFVKMHNAESAKPFVWTKDAESIIAKVEKVKNAQLSDAN